MLPEIGFVSPFVQSSSYKLVKVTKNTVKKIFLTLPSSTPEDYENAKIALVVRDHISVNILLTQRTM